MLPLPDRRTYRQVLPTVQYMTETKVLHRESEELNDITFPFPFSSLFLPFSTTSLPIFFPSSKQAVHPSTPSHQWESQVTLFSSSPLLLTLFYFILLSFLPSP